MFDNQAFSGSSSPPFATSNWGEREREEKKKKWQCNLKDWQHIMVVETSTMVVSNYKNISNLNL